MFDSDKAVLSLRDEALAANARIRPRIRETPLEYSAVLSQQSGAEVYLKLENFQLTGSFKIRGALNRLMSLDEATRREGIVTASSGNHGAAVAYSLGVLGMKGTIWLPETTSATKVDALRVAGADIRMHGRDCAVTEIFARQEAERTGRFYVSPYNDLKVVAGQATVGIELDQQLPAFDTVLVPVGGGGLISGIGGFLKTVRPGMEIIGCQPEHSAVMAASVAAGRILELPSRPTLADGTAGGLEPGCITFKFCRQLVDEFLLVSEAEIAAALRLMIQFHGQLVEGAGALSVAAFLHARQRFAGRRVVLIISGSRLGLDGLRMLLQGP